MEHVGMDLGKRESQIAIITEGHLSSFLCLTSSRGLLEAAVEEGVHLVE